MELRLVVLAGAKQGTRIPLKKDKFIIGRAKECTLRAGSEAISRRHCAILRREAGWSVRDLKSRNGTYLNDERIEQETLLKAGDELRVGPLKFRVESNDTAAPAKSAEAPRAGHPPVNKVADAAQKAASKSEQTATEEDISRWLLGVSDPNKDESLKETRTISMQETTTLGKVKSTRPGGKPSAPDPSDPQDDDSADLVPIEDDEQNESGAGEKRAEKGAWNLLDLVKGKKKKPGKLPPRANSQPTKDSTEAAADILREMTRRR
jgi:predicted component of type VI protein secretion system